MYFRALAAQGRSVASVDNMDDDDDLDLSASLWFQTLDKILSAKGAASRGTGPSSDSTSSKASGTASVGAGSANTGRTKKAGGLGGSGELPQTAAVMQGVLDALLQRTLGSMAGDGLFCRVLELRRRMDEKLVLFRSKCMLSFCIGGLKIVVEVEETDRNGAFTNPIQYLTLCVVISLRLEF